ncbi:hypothetical protein [Lysinibacillus sp.]|uniref:hypothetical protein n=1 Tax=Lysinibacillus sp. TaxID=1869345 RepID=UPI00289EE0BA|nr:hypothetical protein [Lysinibacillus sp.]
MSEKAEKVKVSREVAEALVFLQNNGESTSDIILEFADRESARHELYVDENFNKAYKLIFNNFEVIADLASALIKGYETEETAEEKVAKKYREKRELCNTNKDDKWEHDAYANGIMFTLFTLGIRIKGVNE